MSRHTWEDAEYPDGIAVYRHTWEPALWLASAVVTADGERPVRTEMTGPCPSVSQALRKAHAIRKRHGVTESERPPRVGDWQSRHYDSDICISKRIAGLRVTYSLRVRGLDPNSYSALGGYDTAASALRRARAIAESVAKQRRAHTAAADAYQRRIDAAKRNGYMVTPTTGGYTLTMPDPDKRHVTPQYWPVIATYATIEQAVARAQDRNRDSNRDRNSDSDLHWGSVSQPANDQTAAGAHHA